MKMSLMAPTNVSVSLQQTGSDWYAAISWTDNNSLETGFEVQQSSSDVSPPVWNAFVPIATMGENATKCLQSVSYQVNYKYRVRALKHNQKSDWSNEAILERPPGLEAPTNLIAMGALNPADNIWYVNIAFTDNATSEALFNVQRSELVDGVWTTFHSIGSLFPNSQNWSDGSITQGLGYKYRVRAEGAGFVGDWSNEAVVSWP